MSNCLTDTKDIVSLLEYTKARRVGDKTNFLFLESPVRFKSAMSQRVMKKESGCTKEWSQ